MCVEGLKEVRRLLRFNDNDGCDCVSMWWGCWVLGARCWGFAAEGAERGGIVTVSKRATSLAGTGLSPSSQPPYRVRGRLSRSEGEGMSDGGVWLSLGLAGADGEDVMTELAN